MRRIITTGCSEIFSWFLEPLIFKFSCQAIQKNKLKLELSKLVPETLADEVYTLQTYARKVAEFSLRILELADFFITVKISY